MSLVPFLASGVEMEPTSAALKGYIGGQGGSGGLSPQSAPFLHGGNLYTVLQGAGPIPGSFTPSGGIFVYQSTDQGATWASLDTANGPTRTDMTPVAGFFFDGNHTIIVAWIPDGGPLVGHTGAINLKNFDLTAGTWGATYGTSGAPLVWQVGQCYQRPDGSILVFGSPNRVSGNVQGETAYVFSGGAWSSFACDTNLGAGFAATGNVASVMDSTGNIHLFMIAKDSPVTTSHLAYQLVLTTNTLGTSAVVQSAALNLPGKGEYQPGISGDNVIIGIVDATNSFPTVAVGTPLSAPVFTTLGSPGIDPSLPTLTSLFCPVIAADATGIYASYILQNGGNKFIRTCLNTNITTPLVGWTQSIQAFDASGSAGDAAGWQFLGIARDAGNLFASASTTVGGIGQPTQFWLGVFSPAPPVVIPFTPTVTTGGGPYVIPKPCLCDIEDLAWEAIRDYRERKGAWPYPWTDPPPGAIRVTAPGVIPVPTVLAGETQGLLYKVDQGFQFALVALVVEFFGGALLPGDFTWSLDVNRPVGVGTFQGMPVQGFTRVDVPLGSLEIPWPLEAPDIYNPNDVLRTKFFNANLAPGAPNFLKSILLGWRWPVQ